MTEDARGREELFPSVGGEPDPLWALMEEGSDVPLHVYMRLDEAHVWGLVQRWRSASDPTLRDLCTRLKQRRYLKAMQVSSDLEQFFALAKEAEAYTRQLHPELDLASYVHTDQIDRETYKPYRWTTEKKADSGEKPILLVSKSGHLRPIEHEAEGTLKLLDARFGVKRLLVLEEVRDRLQPKAGKA